jgi:hypothetical protein
MELADYLPVARVRVSTENFWMPAFRTSSSTATVRPKRAFASPAMRMRGSSVWVSQIGDARGNLVHVDQLSVPEDGAVAGDLDGHRVRGRRLRGIGGLATGRSTGTDWMRFSERVEEDERRQQEEDRRR